MSKLLRRVLVWLLVLALPAQGAMAATKLHCGPGHGHRAAVSAAATDAHAHAHQLGLAHAHPGHGEAAAHALPDAAHTHASDGLSATAGTASAAADTQDSKCSACASCCSAAALLGSRPGVPPWQPAPTVFGVVVPSVEAVAAGGPDRPPRHRLA